MNSEMDIKIFEFAYELALRDATMMTAYPVKKDKLRKREITDNARDNLKDYIDAIMKSELTEEVKHKDKFDELVETLENVFSEENCDKAFTFGNIQKLINMTVKYMYIATYNIEGLRKNFRYCHCPLDRKMRDEVLKKLKKLINENDLCREEALSHIKELKECNFSECAWSKIEKNIDIEKCQNEEKKKSRAVYDRFQDAVKFLADKQGISPIEFDYQNWLPDD